GALTKPLTGTISNTAANIAPIPADRFYSLAIAASGTSPSVVIYPNYSGCVRAKAITGIAPRAVLNKPVTVQLATNKGTATKRINTVGDTPEVTTDLAGIDQLRYAAYSDESFQIDANLSMLCSN
ncbi:hypothetical protein, partial [Kribbella deserti]